MVTSDDQSIFRVDSQSDSVDRFVPTACAPQGSEDFLRFLQPPHRPYDLTFRRPWGIKYVKLSFHDIHNKESLRLSTSHFSAPVKIETRANVASDHQLS